MEDSWEKEDFEIPTITTHVKPGAVRKPEEEEPDQLVFDETVSATAPSSTMIEAAKKQENPEEIRPGNPVKFAHLDHETPERRKIRESKQFEVADATAAGEMFGDGGNISSSATGTGLAVGLGGAVINTKRDHINFGLLCSKKMADSTPLNITAFHKSFIDSTKEKLMTESIDEILEAITAVREERRQAGPVNKKAAQAAHQKMKKEIDAEVKKHAASFGGGDDCEEAFSDVEGMHFSSSYQEVLHSREGMHHSKAVAIEMGLLPSATGSLQVVCGHNVAPLTDSYNDQGYFEALFLCEIFLNMLTRIYFRSSKRTRRS